MMMRVRYCRSFGTHSLHSHVPSRVNPPGLLTGFSLQVPPLARHEAISWLTPSSMLFPARPDETKVTLRTLHLAPIIGFVSLATFDRVPTCQPDT